MAGLSGCSSSSSPVVEDKFSVQSLETDDGYDSTTVYEKGSGDRVFRLSVLDSERSLANVYVGGRPHVTVFDVVTGNPDLIDVAIGENFTPLRVANVDEDDDGRSDYLRVDLPSGDKEFRSYYDLDRNGSFDVMGEPMGKRLWVLVSNAWLEVVYEPVGLLSSDGFRASPLGQSTGGGLVFDAGEWKTN